MDHFLLPHRLEAAVKLGLNPGNLYFFETGNCATTFSTLEPNPKREVIYKTVLATPIFDPPHPWRQDIALAREIDVLDLLERKAKNWPVDLPQMLYVYPDKQTYIQRKLPGKGGYHCRYIPPEKLAKELAQFVVLFDDLIKTNQDVKLPVLDPFLNSTDTSPDRTDFETQAAYDLCVRAWDRSREKMKEGITEPWNLHGDIWESNILYDSSREKIFVIDYGCALVSSFEYQAAMLTRAFRHFNKSVVPNILQEISRLTGTAIDRDLYACHLTPQKDKTPCFSEEEEKFWMGIYHSLPERKSTHTPRPKPTHTAAAIG